MKRCSKCRQYKPASEFTRNRSEPSGLTCDCKECSNRDRRVARLAAGVKPRSAIYPTSGSKVCASCKETLPIEQFSKRNAPGRSPSVNSSCKACCQQKFAAWQRSKGRVSRVELNARQRATRTCKDCRCPLPAEGRRAYCNPCRSIREAANYAKRKEAAAIKRRLYREQNLEKVRLWSRLGEHRRRDASKIAPEDWQWVLDTYGSLCLACGSADPPTIDHVKPVSLGGTNDRFNLQPLCLSCNCSKHAKHIDYRPFPPVADAA